MNRDLDESLRQFLEEEAPTLPADVVQQRVLRSLSLLGMEVDKLADAVPRMDIRSEAGKLYLRHRINRILELIEQLGRTY